MREQLDPPFERLLGAVPAYVAQIALDGALLYINRLAAGSSPDVLRGATVFDITAPASHDRLRAAIAEAIAERRVVGFSSVADGAHGRQVPCYTQLVPLGDGERVESIVVLATDLSHAVEAHHALEESEAKLRLVLATTGMGIWTHDPQRGETHWDATLSRIFGYAAAPRTMSNEESIRHMHPEDLPLIMAARARQGEHGYGPVEHRVIRADGTVRWVQATGRMHGSGDTLRVIGGVLDITERKLQEDRLVQAQKLDSIGRLAGGIAHDFNNMLTAILAYTELSIAAATAGRVPALDDLRQIRRGAERSRELTSRLLAFARKQRVEARVIDPNQQVAEIVRLLQRIVGEDVEITTAPRSTRHVKIDPNQLEQLLINLASNARDAMPGGGRLALDTVDLDLDAATGALAAGPHVEIRVTDTGSGIPPELLPHVFEPFFTTKEPGKGTGLGLAQCYGIARQAGGELRLRSEVGAGTAVTLVLPAATPEPASERAGSPAVATGTETVLLVEDEQMIRPLVARVLAEHGYRVLEASNGAEALAVAAGHAGAIDLLLTDMVMPKMTGLELARRLRAQRPGLAVLIMSGYAPQLGPDDRVELVTKPFLPDELLARVRSVLG